MERGGETEWRKREDIGLRCLLIWDSSMSGRDHWPAYSFFLPVGESTSHSPVPMCGWVDAVTSACPCGRCQIL